MTLLAAMVNVAVRGLYAVEIGDGLRLKGWREPQLIALQEQLKTIDILPPVKQAFTIESTIAFHTLEGIPSAGMMKRSPLSGLCPSGWGYQHIADRVRLDFDRLEILDTDNQVIHLDKAEAVLKKFRALERRSPFKFVPSLTPGNFERAYQVAAHNQTQINQTLIVCALERYHLAHNDYPENLDALVPQFLDKLPNDIFNGQPQHYRRNPDGTFILYSIGWNGRDDGGARGHPPENMDADWVWPD
jgi:hypothetical protein